MGDDDADVGVAGNKIVRVGKGLKASHARVAIEAEGYSLSPQVVEGAAAELKLLDGDRTIMIVRGGKILTDAEGLSVPDVSRAGPYSNFK
jgi:hypothetical protein